jgi:hypothetical protein
MTSCVVYLKLLSSKFIRRDIFQNISLILNEKFGGIGIWMIFGNLLYGPPWTISETFILIWLSLDICYCMVVPRPLLLYGCPWTF